jgi:uncharacterized RDD family membrane protein YckC
VTALRVPAPLWRRLAASFYDALLFGGVWMAALFIDVWVRGALDLPPNYPALRACLFLIGLVFFGWFWTHGGQTLGMRAWRLQVRRTDGAVLRWTDAVLRYAAAWISWGAAMLGMLWCAFDPRRRTWHDIASGTEVVVLKTSPD